MAYKCICGAEFNNPQKFNRHKADCRIHLEAKGVDYDEYKRNIFIKQSNASKMRAQLRRECLQREKQNALQIWIDERHLCETCGEAMTVKYGSGRFCSKSCANTRVHNDETKAKIGRAGKANAALHCNRGNDLFKTYGHKLHEKSVAEYNLDPSFCVVCNKILPYELRYRKTCSSECWSCIVGGVREGSAKMYKYGTYKDIECDSSYELAFVVYCFEHNIPFNRNYNSFIYTINNKEHRYFPDFKINDTYVEIKGFYTDMVEAKASAIPDNEKYIILYEADLKPCIDYCIEKYGKKYWEVLYDKDKPSCNDKNKQ